MQNQLLTLRKRIYRNLKKKAYSLEGKISGELKSYRSDQVRFAKRDFQPSDTEELTQKVMSSDVIFLGDFHTFDQNARNALRVLKVLNQSEKKCIIGLEMIHTQHQICIDAYLEGHLTEFEFLESIYYHNSWRFPWTHYKVIFDMAKANQIKILALNTKGSLKERDLFAAKKLDHILSGATDIQILVMYGELHIAPNKIPERLKELNPACTQMIIHQNLDEVYWKMTQEQLSEKIVRFNESEFCINSAPPWVKYESMIYWYENLDDDPDFDIHEYIIEKGKKVFSDDTHENFLAIAQEMLQTVELEIGADELENFNLLDHTALAYVQDKVNQIDRPTVVNFYKELIATGKSFKLPDDNTFYCSSYSMNRISYLAGIHIFHLTSQQKGEDSSKCLRKNNREKIFALFALESMYGHFFSKIFNPHRKCDMYWNLAEKLKEPLMKSESKIHQATIEVLDFKALENALFGLTLFEIYRVGEMVGHIFGEYLYLKASSLEGLGLGLNAVNVKSILFEHSISSADLVKIQTILFEGLDYRKHKKRFF